MNEAAAEVILFHGVYGLNIFLSTSDCFLLSHRWNFLSRLNCPHQIPGLHIEKKKKRREKRLKPSNT